MTDLRVRQTSDLLALRDGELTDAGSADRSRELLGRPGAAREFDQIGRIRNSLQALPGIEPTPELWAAIVAASEASEASEAAEVQTARTGTRAAAGADPVIQAAGRFRFAAGRPVALAAGLMLAVLVSLMVVDRARLSAVPETGIAAVEADDHAIRALHERSRTLEPLVQRTGRVADPVEQAVKYRIADLDVQLADYADGQPDQRQAEKLWGQRVALLESLAEVRRARAALQPAVY